MMDKIIKYFLLSLALIVIFIGAIALVAVPILLLKNVAGMIISFVLLLFFMAILMAVTD